MYVTKSSNALSEVSISRSLQFCFPLKVSHWIKYGLKCFIHLQAVLGTLIFTGTPPRHLIPLLAGSNARKCQSILFALYSYEIEYCFYCYIGKGS
jgi:hypothetical protein